MGIFVEQSVTTESNDHGDFASRDEIRLIGCLDN